MTTTHSDPRPHPDHMHCPCDRQTARPRPPSRLPIRPRFPAHSQHHPPHCPSRPRRGPQHGPNPARCSRGSARPRRPMQSASYVPSNIDTPSRTERKISTEKDAVEHTFSPVHRAASSGNSSTRSSARSQSSPTQYQHHHPQKQRNEKDIRISSPSCITNAVPAAPTATPASAPPAIFHPLWSLRGSP